MISSTQILKEANKEEDFEEETPLISETLLPPAPAAAEADAPAPVALIATTPAGNFTIINVIVCMIVTQSRRN